MQHPVTLCLEERNINLRQCMGFAKCPIKKIEGSCLDLRPPYSGNTIINSIYL